MIRWMISTAVVIVTVPFTMIVTAPQAHACSCAALTFSDQVARSSAVFSGRVTGGGSAQVGGSADPVGWTFDVDRVYAGTVHDEQVVVSAQSEVSCGFEFETGRTYLVVGRQAQNLPGPAEIATGLCDGTRPISAVSPSELESVGDGVSPEPRPPRAGQLVPSGDAGAGARLVAVGLGGMAAGGMLVALVALRRRSRPGPRGRSGEEP